jgi:protocatechuate 3,4-dioxygenase beta subunit
VLLAADFVALSFAAASQVAPPAPPPIQGPVRDPGRRPPPDPTGTAVIRGRVVAADTGTPIRGAVVNLSVAPPAVVTPSTSFARPKAATTDPQGAFEFTGLPGGSYRLMARPGQYFGGYLGISYGATKPSGPGSSDPGTPIDLADGQAFDKATIALPRGAVLTGRVTDENGNPLTRVQVYTLLALPGSSRTTRAGGGAQTDDLGQFRLYGLTPGDYVVAAEARGNTFVPPDAPPETEAEKIGLLSTFYPGTPDEAAAQRVRAKAGMETGGIEIRVVSGRLLHINGSVIDSQGRAMPRANGTLYSRGAGGGMMSTFGFSTDAQGRFQMRNIPPGNYRLTVREQPQRQAGGPPELGEFASLPIALGTDLDDVLVTLSPGATITGTVFFENAAPQPGGGRGDAAVARVLVSMGDPDALMGMPLPPPTAASPDLTFTIKGLSEEVLLRASAPGAVLKSVLLGGEDVTDTPHLFKTGDRVTLVMTSNGGTIEGTVSDGAGKPVTDASLILFGDDKSSWRVNSIHTKRAGTDPAGRYRLMNVLPGRYYLVALPRERMNGLTLGADPAVFEALTREATTLVIGADEQRQVDVKVSSGGGD